MSQQLTDLQAAVSKIQSDVATAVTLIGSLENPTQLQPLIDALTAADASLTAAIAAATPAAPTSPAPAPTA